MKICRMNDSRFFFRIKVTLFVCSLLLAGGTVFAQKNQPKMYCPTGEPPAFGQFMADTSWGYYTNGQLAFTVKYTPDTLPVLIAPVPQNQITHQQIYYKNGQLAFFKSPDSLVSYTKKGQRKLYMQQDCVVIYRRNGSPMLACNDSHRVYMTSSGKPVYERFNDSLVAYDRGRIVKAHARIYNDSINVYKADSCIYSGSIQNYIFSSSMNLFFVLERKEIKTESDILFLLVEKEMIVHENKRISYRRPNKKDLPGNSYFLFFCD